jgi:hypothetical protein
MLELKAFSALHLPATDTVDDFRELVAQVSGQAIRRVSRFGALALAGAYACRKRAGTMKSDCAVYFCSEQPNLNDMARTVHGITMERRPPTPFDFLNISSNVTGFHVARHLGLNGANLTLCRSDSSFEAGLELALLSAPAHAAVLVGYVEDCARPLWQQRERVGWPREKPIAECSHWLYFERGTSRGRSTLEFCRRFADRDAAVADLRGIEGAISFGLRIDDAEASSLQEALGGRSRFTAVESPIFTKGMTALTLCRFAERGEAGRLLHINRTAGGEYYATALSIRETA